MKKDIYKSVLLVSLSVRGLPGDTAKAEKDALAKASKAVNKTEKQTRLSGSRFKAFDLGDKLREVEARKRDLRGTFGALAAWNDTQRAIATRDYSAFSAKIAEQTDNLKKAFEAFCDEYESVREKLVKANGGLLNPSKYPTAQTYRERFAVKFETEAFPTNDFRSIAGITPQVRKQIKAETEARLAEKVNGSLVELCSRMVGDSQTHGLLHYVSRVQALENPDGRFHESAISKFKELAEAIERANVFEDSKVASFVSKMKELASVPVIDLRQDEKVRKTAIKSATKAIADIESAMKGF